MTNRTASQSRDGTRDSTQVASKNTGESHAARPSAGRRLVVTVAVATVTVVLAAALSIGAYRSFSQTRQPVAINYLPRERLDESGYQLLMSIVKPWPRDASPVEIGAHFDGAAQRRLAELDKELTHPHLTPAARCELEFSRAHLFNLEGDPDNAYAALSNARKALEGDPAAAQRRLFTIVYFQGVTALRKGENENCILCRGESSCILPVAATALHENPAGSQLAIEHFTEYLTRFPDDLEARWLLNVAHMTLGEHPQKVDPRFVIPLDQFQNSDHSIGKFRDIGHLVKLNRFNQAGGGILEDFDGDGLLDVVVSTFDPTSAMGFFRNTGEGTFEELTQSAGLENQVGGLNCVQTDYNNDGRIDVLIIRGAWLSNEMAMPPSLLRNNGDRTFTDVTIEAGLQEPGNSIAAAWTDYDNDGWLDLFVCCEQQPNRLYRNRGDGTFEEVAALAGVRGSNSFHGKGAAWIDFDNDNYQDLFVNHLSPEGARLYRNNHDGTFREETAALGIDGPQFGFSCWAWDYDNDGWQDIFATCYDRTLGDVVLGIMGQQHHRHTNRLFRNREGQGFEDVTKSVGLAACFSTMGSNFADFDNDGWLDIYLGTGEPNLSTLVPNRMFINLVGRRFAEVTASSGTGHLQKGHGVACGDWDRDGNVDLFLEMGGAVNGDRYHNILFQNPGHENAWCTLKLIGEETNRAAIGTRIKIITAGENPQTIYRTVSSGSSFGANPLEQTIGLGQTDRIASLEIQWPKSGTIQTFQNVPIGKFLEITEFAEAYRVIDHELVKTPRP